MSSLTSSNGKVTMPPVKAITRKRTAKPVRKNPPREGRRPTPQQQTVMLDDDPPQRLPPDYKSPAKFVKDGDEIQVYWEGDERFYPATVRNLRADGRHRVEYHDGQVMYHVLSNEVMLLAGKALETFLANKFPDAVDLHFDDHPVPYPDLTDLITIGCCVEVYWYPDKKYYRGMVEGKDNCGRFHISFDEFGYRTLTLAEETFRFVGLSAARAYSQLL